MIGMPSSSFAWFASILVLYLLAVPLCLASHTQYQVIIDSGSTGSRVYVYRYLTASPITSLFEVAHKRVRPALSTFYNNRSGLEEQLGSLINFAQAHVRPHHQALTPISLKATAGLRVMDIDEQDWIITNVREILSQTNFSFNPVETRVISGNEEALFALLATNMAFSNVSDDFELQLAAADLGGSSTQIAFVLPSRILSLTSLTQLSWTSLWNLWFLASYPQDCRPDYRLLLPGSAKYIEVFARSIPGMGIVAAMAEITDRLAEQFVIEQQQESMEEDLPWGERRQLLLGLCPSESPSSACSGSAQIYPSYGYYELALRASQQKTTLAPYVIRDHPCVSPGARYPFEVPDSSNPLWIGTGNFSECVRLIRGAITRKAQSESSCMKMLRPKTIIGVDNFPKTLEVLGLRGDQGVAPAVIRQAGETICKQPWPEVLARFPSFPAYRAQQACFGAAFMYAFAKDVYQVGEHDATTFVPTDEHHHFSVGWPLGAALYHATNLSFDSPLLLPSNVPLAM
eukprot:scaffold1160_cov174-Ochromonas_danica.AAC.31